MKFRIIQLITQNLKNLRLFIEELQGPLDAGYDTIGTYGLDTTFFIPTDDLSLLAILNSQLFDWYASA